MGTFCASVGRVGAANQNKRRVARTGDSHETVTKDPDLVKSGGVVTNQSTTICKQQKNQALLLSFARSFFFHSRGTPHAKDFSFVSDWEWWTCSEFFSGFRRIRGRREWIPTIVTMRPALDASLFLSLTPAEAATLEAKTFASQQPQHESALDARRAQLALSPPGFDFERWAQAFVLGVTALGARVVDHGASTSAVTFAIYEIALGSHVVDQPVSIGLGSSLRPTRSRARFARRRSARAS